MRSNLVKKYELDSILESAIQGVSLNIEEIYYLLALTDPLKIEKVMAAARTLREKYFDNKIFFYGFVYFSTYCRNQCNFCFYRKDNNLSPRYRKNNTEILNIATQLAESGVHLIDLTMGEDPLIYDEGHFDQLLEIVSEVRSATNLPVMVSPGLVPDNILTKLVDLGVDWFALYQETYNTSLYRKLRVGQSFVERTLKRKKAAKLGMLVEDGILLGVGESVTDRAMALMEMKNSPNHQVRVMSFVAQEDTPMRDLKPIPRFEEYLTIAVMRLIMPHRLIPASLDVDGIRGLKARLRAGANVVTSIIPPSQNLAGVSRAELDIEQGLRTSKEVEKILVGEDLQRATLKDYQNWLQKQLGEKYD